MSIFRQRFRGITNERVLDSESSERLDDFILSYNSRRFFLVL